MNKTEFIERVAQEADVSTSEAQRYFDAFEQVVIETLKGGEEVRITGFGKFSVKERKAREGRNPQTVSMVVEKCRCMVVEKCRSRAVIRPQLLASGLASPPSFSMISNLPRSL